MVIVATVILSQLTSLILPQEFMAVQLTEEQSQDFELLKIVFEDLSEVVQENIGSFYLYFGLQIFLSVLLMFAPYLASLNGKDGLESLADSIKLALPNFLTIFLAFFFVISLPALIAVLALILASQISTLLTVLTVLAVGLSPLVIVPFLCLLSFDIFV